MSRKKHAWNALWDCVGAHATVDEIFRAERAVENAVIEDFTDRVYEEIEQLFSLLDAAPNDDIKLGILLAENAMRKTLDNWYSK